MKSSSWHRCDALLCLVVAMLFICPLVLFSGCDGGGDDDDDGGDAAAEMEAVAADVSTIIADNIDFGDLAASLQNIEDILVDEVGDRVAGIETGADYITVVHNNISRETWFYNPLLQEPELVAPAAAGARPAAVVGNQTATVVDVLANDPIFAAQHGAVLAAIRAQLAAMGFTVERVDGAAANINAFGRLDGAGVVFLITHGISINADYFLETGEAVSVANRAAYLADWQADVIRPSHALYQGSPGVAAGKWMVSQRFFDREFSAGDFPGTLFYNGACQGTTNTALSTILDAKGVACYVGWSQSQGVSPWHAHALFGLMADGSDVSTAMPRVPGGLSQWLVPPAVPQLGFGSDGTTQLRAGGSTALAVATTSPANGAEIPAATVAVQGTVSPMSADVDALIEVNGVAEPLALAGDGSFNTVVNLIAGANTIRVTAVGTVGAGTATLAVTRTEPGPENAMDVVASWDNAASRVDLYVVQVADPSALATMPLWTHAQWVAFMSGENCSIYTPNASWGGRWTASGAQEQTVSLQTAPGTATTYAVLLQYHGLLPGGGPTTAANVDVSIDTDVGQHNANIQLVNGGALAGANPFDVATVALVTLPSGLINSGVANVYTLTPAL